MDKETKTDGTLYMGSLFFAVVLLMFNGMSEMAMTVAKLPVFYKQRDVLFFPTWIIKIQVSLFDAGLWISLAYYVIGYDLYVGR